MDEEERRKAILDLARTLEYDISFDHEATISEGDENGCYVQAWVYVSFADTPLDKEVK